MSFTRQRRKPREPREPGRRRRRSMASNLQVSLVPATSKPAPRSVINPQRPSCFFATHDPRPTRVPSSGATCDPLPSPCHVHRTHKRRNNCMQLPRVEVGSRAFVVHLQTVTTATAAEVDAQVDGQVEPKPEPRERRASHLFSGGLGLRAGSKRWGKPGRPGGKGLLLLRRHAAVNEG